MCIVAEIQGFIIVFWTRKTTLKAMASKHQSTVEMLICDHPMILTGNYWILNAPQAMS
jgi:hypothetical protein